VDAGRCADQQRMPPSTWCARKIPGMTKITANEQWSKGWLSVCIEKSELALNEEEGF